jgi:protein TonB
MSVTVHTFPPFQSMNSPRAWALAIIVLMHLVLFWALTSGLSTRIMTALTPPTLKVIEVQPEKVVERPRMPPTEVTIDQPIVDPVFVPRPDELHLDESVTPDPLIGTTTDLPRQSEIAEVAQEPRVEQPLIDPRLPLSEPTYPPTEIRLGHTGTVMLGVYVLENGRVGEVRIEQSSGFARLDSAAQHEARRWRFKPGTRDGQAVAMWKTIPITFQLKK